MLPALLLLIAEPHVINLQERVPLALVVSTPTGQTADISKSELIRLASDLVKRHTDFFPQELDELVVEDCKGRLTCLALKSRREQDVEDGPVQPRYLLLISNVSIPDGPDRLTIVLLDIEEAIRIHREATRKVGWQDEVEATVSEQAMIGAPIRGQIADPQEAATFLATSFTRELSRGLEEAGHWEPYGDIELECDVEGAVIRLDGNGLGSTKPGITRLSGARPGKRALEVVRPGYLPYQDVVEITRGGVARMDITFALEPSNTSGVVRHAVLWSGVAVAAAGAAIAIFGAVKAGGAETSCYAPCDAGTEFITFGYDESRASSTLAVNPGGVAIAPLGIALAGTGLTWTIGTWLIGDDDDIPWVQLLVGLGVGGAAYAISVLADGTTPEAE